LATVIVVVQPGIVIVLPGVPPVQVIVAVAPVTTGFGLAVQSGSAGAGSVSVNATGLLFDMPDGSSWVAGGLLLTWPLPGPPVPVQTTVPDARVGIGAQAVPGIEITSPGVAPVQVIVTGAPVGAEAGSAVQLGAGGVTACVNGTIPLLVNPVF
jgi:hypothetical protein